MSSYLAVMQSILDGVPWTPEKAEVEGFPSIHAARDRILGCADVWEDSEEEWQELESRFEQAVIEIRQSWGVPESHGPRASRSWHGAWPEIERLAYWRRGDRIAYIKLELCDNTRMRMLTMGERYVQEYANYQGYST